MAVDVLHELHKCSEQQLFESSREGAIVSHLLLDISLTFFDL